MLTNERIARLRRRLADESGMTLAVVMGTMLIATLFSVAAIAATQNDFAPARKDVTKKEAYAAAEAGVNDYLQRLNSDSNFWTYCDTAAQTTPTPVSQKWTSASVGTRPWRTVAGSADSAYTIELLPANGASACSTTNASGTMIDSGTGMLSVRVTGRANTNGKGTYSYRSIVTSFRRDSFLDFLYFTDLETLDPEYLRGTSGYTSALNNCKIYVRDGRPSSCTGINFATGDAINGPAHTNDRFLITGSPKFGRSKADSIESSGPNPGWEANGSATPNFVGTFKYGANTLTMPPTNSSLASVAGVTYTGQTAIKLKGTTMDVRNKTVYPDGLFHNVAIPANGVVYVKDGGCSQNFNGTDPYATVPDNCPILRVGGTYSKNITLGSQGDILIDPNYDSTGPVAGKGIRKNGDYMAGLIADNFIRVYHPVDDNPCNSSTNNSSDSTLNVQIDAAILSLQHSFWVDNYTCGDREGNLIVNGAIAQKFRGPVGTVGSTGYTKAYTYDDRLKYRSPPYFLDPIESRWAVREFNEQLPANGP